MGLFMTDDLVGRGLPMFLPAGYTVWQELENYIKEKERLEGVTIAKVDENRRPIPGTEEYVVAKR